MQFKDVIGQAELKKHLIQEAQADKISHAQLFLGNGGHGGLPLALAFAQFILCENKEATDSCGSCASCRKVQEMQHPDVHFVFPVVQAIEKTAAKFLPQWREQCKEQPYFTLTDWIRKIDVKERQPVIGTEESQDIIRKLSLKSYEGGYKIMLIWGLNEMNATCANKLLKILEEPPSKTIFIGLSDTDERIMPTIQSRMQIVRIPRIDRDELTHHLRTKHTSISGTAIDSLVAQTDGNYNLVLEMIEGQLDADQYRDLFIQLMRVSYKKDVIAMLDWAEDASSLTKDRLKHFLSYCLHMFRQSILRNYTDDQLTRLSEEEAAFLKNFSRFITGNNVMDFMDNFSDAHYHIERNAHAKLLLTNLCFKVMRFIHVA